MWETLHPCKAECCHPMSHPFKASVVPNVQGHMDTVVQCFHQCEVRDEHRGLKGDVTMRDSVVELHPIQL